MKIWQGYGSEHSANLVMIGHFKDVTTATKAKETIDRLSEQASEDFGAGDIETGGSTSRYTKAMMEVLETVKIYDVNPSELEQFVYDTHVHLKGDQIRITTDESDVAAFMKVLIDKGARVEVFCAHDYPDAAIDGEA
ncbi:MAG: DUF6375 family protein [Planctomycetaceae bacterium]|nr:DUF6375 family protein [Planctomycetaceae bacterium]